MHFAGGATLRVRGSASSDAGSDPDSAVGYDDALWLLASLSSLFRIPFDAALVAQNFPPPFTRATLKAAAHGLGIKTSGTRTERADWQKLPLPAIAFERAAATAQASTVIEFEPPAARMHGNHAADFASRPPSEIAVPGAATRRERLTRMEDEVARPEQVAVPLRPVLIVKASSRELLYFSPERQNPQTVPIGEVSQRWSPELILAARQPAVGARNDEDTAGGK